MPFYRCDRQNVRKQIEWASCSKLVYFIIIFLIAVRVHRIHSIYTRSAMHPKDEEEGGTVCAIFALRSNVPFATIYAEQKLKFDHLNCYVTVRSWFLCIVKESKATMKTSTNISIYLCIVKRWDTISIQPINTNTYMHRHTYVTYIYNPYTCLHHILHTCVYITDKIAKQRQITLTALTSFFYAKERSSEFTFNNNETQTKE